jgi:hypothetical protein
MIEIHVTGLEELSKACHTAADELPNEIVDGIDQGLTPLIQAARASAMATLPVSGGLAARVAASRFTKTRRGTSVRVQVSNAYNIDAMDKGVVHHPVYGHGMVTQSVPAGWWTDPREWFALSLWRAA